MRKKKIKILLIDDDRKFWGQIQNLLSRDNYKQNELICVDRLKSGVEKLSDIDFDVALVDLFLPDGVGLNTLIQFRKQNQIIPLITIIHDRARKLGPRALDNGAEEYLIKEEISAALLNKAVEYAIDRKRYLKALKKTGRMLLKNKSWHKSNLENAHIRYEKEFEKKTEDLRHKNDKLQKEIQHFRKSADQLRDTIDELQKVILGIIKAMVSTVETRDPYTAGHQQRVANLARAIAVEMGLPRDRIDGTYIAASIHDLGKIAIPAEILSKPGRITNTEFELIKTHPQVGYDILKEIDFPWPIAAIVRQHHERLDGSGYPDGLMSEEILLEARIVSVADVVEAIASHRPYRPAFSIEKALDEIDKYKGIYYDPEVVMICKRVVNRRGFNLNEI